MAIELKEFVGYAHIYTNAEKPINLKETAMPVALPQMYAKDSLMVDVEGIHSVLTINNNFYEDDCLKKSAPRWTQPYERPVILYHKEEDGQIIGRIKNAEFIHSERSNTGALLFTCNIGDKKGIEGIQNGTLATVSIGAIVYDLRCSICGKNLAEHGECEHVKGAHYDGKLCYWIVKDMEPKELSYVIVPSDKYAHNIKVYKPSMKKLKESIEVNNNMSLSDEIMKTLTEGLKDDSTTTIKEAKVVDEEVKDKVEGGKPEEKEEPKEQEEKPEEKEVEKEEEKAPEDKGEEEAKEKKEEENDNKEEEKSNNNEEGDEKTEIEKLKKENEDLKEQIANLTAQLKKVKEAKEAVDKELMVFKVQEKTQVANNIISLRESYGMPNEQVEDLVKDNSLKELNIMYNTLKEACEIKVPSKLPKKVLKESLVDDENDNTATKVKESAQTLNSIKDDIAYQQLVNTWFK